MVGHLLLRLRRCKRGIPDGERAVPTRGACDGDSAVLRRRHRHCGALPHTLRRVDRDAQPNQRELRLPPRCCTDDRRRPRGRRAGGRRRAQVARGHRAAADCRTRTRRLVARCTRTGKLRPVLYAAFSGRYDRLIWGGVAIAAAIVLSQILRRLVSTLEGRHPDEERELARLRRGETALALVATAVPYVAAIVVLIVGATAFLPRTVAALGGSALILVLVGFGAQRFLMDVIAGALIAFERWYGIGDFVRLEPAQVSGIVEQFGLRTTVIRSLNGDRTYVPNSQIISASRSPRGYRRYSIEVLTTDPDEARHAIEQVGSRSPMGEARFLRAPRVVEERELGEGTWLVRGEADVAPTMEWLAESLLVGRLKASLSSDALLADPTVYTIDERTFSRYQRRVLVR